MNALQHALRFPDQRIEAERPGLRDLLAAECEQLRGQFGAALARSLDLAQPAPQFRGIPVPAR